MAGKKATVDDVAQEILRFLPDDGTPVANQHLASMIARRIGKPVTLDLFYEAHRRLLDEGETGTTKGPVGDVYKQPSRDEGTGAKAITWPEASLMGFLGKWLREAFRKSLVVDESTGAVEVKDTSTAGKAGKWTRPDYVVACADRLTVLPGCRFDVHAFELKREDNGGTIGVHEALAQTRATHYGHLVWHLPARSPHEDKLGETMRQCMEHGIGLVRMRDPSKDDGYDVLVHPRRKDTAPSTVDAFLAGRLEPEQLDRLRRVSRPAP